MGSVLVPLLFAIQQIALPPPRGYVNDFAAVLDPVSVEHMDAVIREVKDKTRGEIAVVTLSDMGDREASDVALQIGRQWGVGAKAAAGDSAKNLGVVVLLVLLKNHLAVIVSMFIAKRLCVELLLLVPRVGRTRHVMKPYF